jgi:hypothetical protein
MRPCAEIVALLVGAITNVPKKCKVAMYKVDSLVNVLRLWHVWGIFLPHVRNGHARPSTHTVGRVW